MREEQEEVAVDTEVARALRTLVGEGGSEFDMARLRHTINERAAPILADRARRRSRRRLAMATLLPIALAASIALTLRVGTGIPDGAAPSPVAGIGLAIDELIRVMEADLPEQEFRLIVTGRADPESLLSFAVTER